MVVTQDFCRHINANPAFHALQKRRSAFSWTLAAIMLGSYYAFIFVVAFQPALFAEPLHDGTVITWGILASLAMIALCLVLTGIYVVRANREFDPATKAIIDAALQATTGDGPTGER